MKILLKRIAWGKNYTIGKLYLDGQYFCDTLEDVDRDLNKDGDIDDKGEEKVYGETAIPAGKYNVELTMSARFGRVLPLIKDVPHFTGIRIHRGNTSFDTHGCILVGINSEKGKVTNSALTEANLIRALQKSYEPITITIE